jgi:hypothetical protein
LPWQVATKFLRAFKPSRSDIGSAGWVFPDPQLRMPTAYPVQKQNNLFVSQLRLSANALMASAFA